MRARILAAALLSGTALAVVPATPAAANCDPVLSLALGRCTNACAELTPDRPCPR